MKGQNLFALEAAHGGPFRFKHRGECHTVVGPRDLQIHQISAILETGHIPGTPPMPAWKRTALFERWCAHYDLPDQHSLSRLIYLVDRYRPKIAVDLARFYPGLDLVELWRERRFGYLLNLIDHLPQHSYYSDAVANDPEHAEMLVKAQEQRDPGDKGEEYHPPMHKWSPEIEVLTRLVDATRGVSHTIQVVNSEKGKAPKPPKSEPRPKTAFEVARKKADNDRRRKSHEKLVKRMLPNKR